MPLFINEINYGPEDYDGDLRRTFKTGDFWEFVELYNYDTVRDLDISGFSFTDGIKYVFPSGTIVKAGEYVTLVHQDSKLGLDTQHVYDGSLKNGEEVITLMNADNSKIVDSVE